MNSFEWRTILATVQYKFHQQTISSATWSDAKTEIQPTTKM
jgi:hypothetical protein